MMPSTVRFIQQPQLYRVKHDLEMGPLWRTNVPEVYPLNGNSTPFGEDWQFLTFAMCPGITGNHWRSVYGTATAFMNGTGYGGSSPRADFVNGLNLSAALPRWDKTRVCGGAVVTGVESGANLIVSILDGTGPAPTLDWIMARPWYRFHAITVYSDGHVGEFPQNNPVYVPLVGSGVATLPLVNLEKLPLGALIPNPYTT